MPAIPRGGASIALKQGAFVADVFVMLHPGCGIRGLVCGAGKAAVKRGRNFASADPA
jgi:hypothetical protein